jgi:hypothetical protein
MPFYILGMIYIEDLQWDSKRLNFLIILKIEADYKKGVMCNDNSPILQGPLQTGLTYPEILFKRHMSKIFGMYSILRESFIPAWRFPLLEFQTRLTDFSQRFQPLQL